MPLGPLVGWGGVENPQELTVYAFPGADGAFTLYEDEGNSTAYLRATLRSHVCRKLGKDHG